MIGLRELEDADVAPLLAIQHAQNVLRWSEEELRTHLFDAGRDGGRNVVVAEREGAVVGCAGWVEAGEWFYGAPVLALDAEAAAVLVADEVARARRTPGAERIRIGATLGELAKRGALVHAGFAPALDFITFTRPLAPGDGRRWMGPWVRVPFADLDFVRFADVLNDTFAGVPNTRPTTADEQRADLARPLTSHEATAAYCDATGAYAAFTRVTVDGSVATVEEIGVRAAHRGGGHAGRILDDVFAQVGPTCTEVRALIASTNEASLALFRARGFTELARRTVYERAL